MCMTELANGSPGLSSNLGAGLSPGLYKGIAAKFGLYGLFAAKFGFYGLLD